ncbi:MAG: hypothetical protein ACREC2_00835, partial [Bradyrhizobium sp.]
MTFSSEPLTIPASPDPENVASSAALKKLPCPAPLFASEPADWLSNVSVGWPTSLVLIPWPRIDGVPEPTTTTFWTTGLVS